MIKEIKAADDLARFAQVAIHDDCPWVRVKSAGRKLIESDANLDFTHLSDRTHDQVIGDIASLVGKGLNAALDTVGEPGTVGNEPKIS